MSDSARFALVVLYWAIRAYTVLIFIWALMTWIPGVAGSSFHNIIGLPVVPVLNVFSFLSFGGIGFGALIVAMLLNFVANWLAKQIVQSGANEAPGVVNAAEMQPADSNRGPTREP